MIAEKVPEKVRIALITLSQYLTNALGSKNGGYYFAMSNYITNGRHQPAEHFNDTIKKRFGEREFNIPKDFHSQLSGNYGDDYMTPIKTAHLNTEDMEIFEMPPVK